MAPESPRSAPRRSGAGTAAAAAAAVKDGGAEGLLSPRFRSAAELAGWDEESVLLAALVVEDTPVRESRRKRRTSTSAGGGDGSTGSNISRKRRRRQPIRPVTLALDDDAKPDNEADGKNDVNQEEGEKEGEKEDKKEGEEEKKFAVVGEEEVACSGEKADPVGNLPCLDRLREELSCAICLEICFEPSTTPCGHSFCMKCLKHAAAKCGKRCPKCRQLICNSRSCHVNTVLWNTIQLLFPTEVEARRTSIASSSSSNDDVRQSLPNSSLSQSGRRTRNSSGAFSTERITARSYVNVFLPDSTTSSNTSGSFVGSRGSTRDSNIRRGFVPASVSTRGSNRRRGFVPASELVTNRNSSRSDQSEDAALAYRLQQEEFINAFESEETQERVPQNSVSTARDNLRAIASRAVRLRARGWPF